MECKVSQIGHIISKTGKNRISGKTGFPEKPDLSGMEPDQDEPEFQPVSQPNNNFVMQGLPNWSYYQ